MLTGTLPDLHLATMIVILFDASAALRTLGVLLGLTFDDRVTAAGLGDRGQ